MHFLSPFFVEGAYYSKKLPIFGYGARKELSTKLPFVAFGVDERTRFVGIYTTLQPSLFRFDIYLFMDICGKGDDYGGHTPIKTVGERGGGGEGHFSFFSGLCYVRNSEMGPCFLRMLSTKPKGSIAREMREPNIGKPVGPGGYRMYRRYAFRDK